MCFGYFRRFGLAVGGFAASGFEWVSLLWVGGFVFDAFGFGVC